MDEITCRLQQKTIIKNRSSNRTCNQSEDILFVPLRKSAWIWCNGLSHELPFTKLQIFINDISNDGVVSLSNLN